MQPEHTSKRIASRVRPKLAVAIQVLLDAADAGDELSVEQVRAEIERAEVAAALAPILDLAPAPAEEDVDVWRAKLVKRYQTGPAVPADPERGRRLRRR